MQHNEKGARPSLPRSTRRRKTGTATNSRFWNWIAVPALPLKNAFTGQTVRNAIQ
jgi:hypothetical protein